MLQPICQNTATTSAAEKDEAEEQDIEGVAQDEEESDEDEEYDTGPENLKRIICLIIL